MSRARVSTRTLVLAGLLVCVVVVGVLSVCASSRPDGLEHVAAQLGFSSNAHEGRALLGDYSQVTGLIGLAVVGLLAFTGFRLLARKPPPSRDDLTERR